MHSGAGNLAKKSLTINKELLAAYVYVHYNWAECAWMRPTIDEIVEAYIAAHTEMPEENDEPTSEPESEGDEEAKTTPGATS